MIISILLTDKYDREISETIGNISWMTITRNRFFIDFSLLHSYKKFIKKKEKKKKETNGINGYKLKGIIIRTYVSFKRGTRQRSFSF